jgi:PKD repeat protein
MADKFSSLDDGYQSGMLSVFPEALDDYGTMYRATNNAQVALKHSLSYNSTRVIVEDTSGFPASGLLRVGPDIGVPGDFEMIYYASKTANTFEKLIRGFAGSKQGYWPARANYVSNTVAAEHHNAVKDAILQMQSNFGLSEFPDPESLNGILKAQEIRFLSPKPQFRAFPIKGPPSLTVRFQNFSTGYIIRYLWDFGDGSTSLERSPVHTYANEGSYTIKLNVVTSTGAQGVATKTDYITVDSDESLPFFYVDSIESPYSQQTADDLDVDPKEFRFVDQSDGDIVQRNWIFGDGETLTEIDPDKHETTHIYQSPGEYIVSQIIQFANGRLKRVELPEPLIVL